MGKEMPRIRLNKSAIDSLPPTNKDTVYWDAGLPGFGVKVTPAGRKVFIVLYRVAGAGSRLRKYTIGPYGRVTLAMARAQAQKIFAARLDGRDPAEEKRESRRRLVVDQISDLVEAFIQQRVLPLRTAKVIANRFRREIVSRWGGKSIHEIKKRDLIELVTEVSSGGPDAGHRVLKSLKTFFKWCVGQGIIDFSPAESVRSYWRVKSRDRILSDQELAGVLLAARQLRPPYNGIIEVLALTGQRREEVAQMQWMEINESSRTWSIPAERSKNGRAHIVHLSQQAWAVIDRYPRTCAYVFATANRKRAQNIKVAKAAVDAMSEVTGWRLHDLRRTVVSGMARLGVAPHVADKILNHQTGTISDVAAVYQRHEFLKERKHALELWAQHVSALRSARSSPEAARSGHRRRQRTRLEAS